MFDPLLPLSDLFPKSILTLQAVLVRRRMLCCWNTTRRKRRRHESQELGQFFSEFSCWNSPVVESQLVGDGHESWAPYVKYSYSGVWCIPTNGRSLEWGTVEVIRTVPQSYRVYLHHLHKDGRISLNSHWSWPVPGPIVSAISISEEAVRGGGTINLQALGCVHSCFLVVIPAFWCVLTTSAFDWKVQGKERIRWCSILESSAGDKLKKGWNHKQCLRFSWLTDWRRLNCSTTRRWRNCKSMSQSILTWRWFHRLHFQLFPNPHVCGDYPIQHECSKLRGVTIWSLFPMNFVKVLIVQIVTVRFSFNCLSLSFQMNEKALNGFGSKWEREGEDRNTSSWQVFCANSRG